MLIAVASASAAAVATPCTMYGGGTFQDTSTGAYVNIFNSLSTDLSARQSLVLNGVGGVGTGNSFVLTSAVNAACRHNLNQPSGDDGYFNKFVATGTGVFNGQPGYLFGIQIGDYGDSPFGEANPDGDSVSFQIVNGSNGQIVWQGTGNFVSFSSTEEIFSGPVFA